MPCTPPIVGPRRSKRVATLTATVTIGLCLVLAGCADDAESSDSATSAPTSETTPSETTATPTDDATPSASATPAAQTIDITVEGDTVNPSGERVDATAGEEIILHVTADAPGEIHVHSTPEQQLSYEPGTSDLSLTIDQPGLVEVESHTLDLVIVQLEVR